MTQISEILNIMHKGNGFSAKPLGKKDSFIAKMSGGSGHGPAGQF